MERETSTLCQEFSMCCYMTALIKGVTKLSVTLLIGLVLNS